MELRETYQTPKHCRLALNVDFSAGVIEARPGLRQIANALRVTTPQIFIVDKPSGEPRILVLGYYNDATPDISVYVLSTDGEIIAGAVSLTQLGEPATPDWRCSVNRVIIGAGHFVALITTPHNSYIWDPYTDETTVRVASTSTDAVKISSPELRYLEDPPRGEISTFIGSLGEMFYAGLKPNASFGVDIDLEAGQEDIAEANVDSSRKGIILGTHAIIGSDSFDPLGVLCQVNFTVPTSERVTGLLPLGEHLGIFTDKNIWALVGDPLSLSSRLSKVVEGVGCVAPHAIVSVRGNVFFIGADGIYVYTAGQAQKISSGIDELWTGRHRVTRMPPELTSLMATLKWPWTIDREKLGMATASHVLDKKQIWFHLPIMSLDNSVLSLTLVYDYEHSAFSYYMRRDERPFATDSAQYTEGGKPRTFVVSLTPGSTTGSNLYEVAGTTDGHYLSDGAAGTGRNGNAYKQATINLGAGIPVVWWGPRIFREAQQTMSFRRLRFTQLAWGKQKTNTNVKWFVEGDASAFDTELEGVVNADATAASGDLDLHPNEDNTYFHGSGVFGTAPFAASQYFDNRVDLPSIQGKWISFGFLDDDGGASTPQFRSPAVTISGYAVDVTPRGSAR